MTRPFPLLRALATALPLLGTLPSAADPTAEGLPTQHLPQARHLAGQSPARAIARLRAHPPPGGQERARWQLLLAQLYAQIPDYESARDQLDDPTPIGLLSTPDQREAWTLLGHIALLQKDYPAAGRHLTQALARCQQGCDPDAILLLLGYSSFYQGHYRQALEWLGRRTGDNETSLRLALTCQQQLQAWPEAIALQRQVLQLAPESLEGWRNLAYLHVNNRQADLAAGVLLLAGQAGALPRDSDWLWLAGLLAEAGVPGYALWLLDKGIAERQLSDSPSVHQARLGYALQAGDHRRASALYRERYERHQRSGDRLGMVTELSQEDPGAALQLLRDLPAEQKTGPEWLGQLVLEAQAGVWDEAAAIADRLQQQTEVDGDPQIGMQARRWLQFIEQRRRLLP